MACDYEHIHTHARSFSVFDFYIYRPTGRPRRASLPSECQRNNTAIRFDTAGVLQRIEEQKLVWLRRKRQHCGSVSISTATAS